VAAVLSVEEIAREVSVRKQTALDWTASIRQAEEDRLNETIFDMYMACRTQEEIAEATGVPRQTVADRLPVLQETFPGSLLVKLSHFEEEGWKPPLYDIWNVERNANEVKHFGNTAVEFGVDKGEAEGYHSIQCNTGECEVTNMPSLMTTEQAANFLQLHPGTLRRKARAGQVPVLKIMRQFRFDPDVLREWLAQGCPTQTEQPTLFDQAAPAP
jgi:excisionase family DNA binding protein